MADIGKPDQPVDTGGSESLLRELLGERYDEFVHRLRERLNRPITIAFMGKTGSGKSTTCNRIFGQDLFRVGAVEATTREMQFVDVPFGESSLLLVDLPGVGESMERSAEYRALYKQVLTEGLNRPPRPTDSIGSSWLGQNRHIDVVVWVIKADDRALEVDEAFYRDVLLEACPPSQMHRVVFAISQADRIDPLRGEGSWDVEAKRPGARQAPHLEQKQQHLARMFDREPADIPSYSAYEGYNLDVLLERVVAACPDEQVPLLVELARRGEAGESVINRRTEERAQETFWETVKRVAEEVITNPKVIEILVKEGLAFLGKLILGITLPRGK